MPDSLVRAHRELNRAVDTCYRRAPFESELQRIVFLFDLYGRLRLAERIRLVAARTAAPNSFGPAEVHRTACVAKITASLPDPVLSGDSYIRASRSTQSQTRADSTQCS
jgi:hypothetical protein